MRIGGVGEVLRQSARSRQGMKDLITKLGTNMKKPAIGGPS
jgi:hypothetical protein